MRWRGRDRDKYRLIGQVVWLTVPVPWMLVGAALALDVGVLALVFTALGAFWYGASEYLREKPSDWQQTLIDIRELPETADEE